MSASRQDQWINANTLLVDSGMGGALGVTAVYLVIGRRTCLIDAGTAAEAPYLVGRLKKLKHFPPDVLVITHPHWDHAQGVPFIRREARRAGKEIRVLAAADALPLLKDKAFNEPFGGGPYHGVDGVAPLRDGELIDLGGIWLHVLDAPGHCTGHIALLDHTNATLFVGDSIGYKTAGGMYQPPFMPPAWDRAAFLATIEKFRRVPFRTLCLSHFGCLTGDAARALLDEAVRDLPEWWDVFTRNAGRIDETEYLVRALSARFGPLCGGVRPVALSRRLGLRLMPRRRREALIERAVTRPFVSWLAAGYKMATGQQAHGSPPGTIGSPPGPTAP